MLRDLLHAKTLFLTAHLDDVLCQESEETLEDFLKNLKRKRSWKLSKLLETHEKEQIDLLKGMSLNPDQLMSVIIFAHKSLVTCIVNIL